MILYIRFSKNLILQNEYFLAKIGARRTGNGQNVVDIFDNMWPTMSRGQSVAAKKEGEEKEKKMSRGHFGSSGLVSLLSLFFSCGSSRGLCQAALSDEVPRQWL